MQLCSSLMAACLNTACLCVRLKFRLAHCHFMTGHALTLVVAVGKQCVYRRQLWKVAMLTWEEVYFSFHNFLHFYFGNIMMNKEVDIQRYLGECKTTLYLNQLFVDRGCSFWLETWWIGAIVVIIAVTSYPKRQNFPSYKILKSDWL